MRRAALTMAVSLAGAVLLGGSLARAEPDAARVLDRTYTCAVTLRGGVYLLDARAHSGTRLHGKWAKLPFAVLRTGVFGGATGNMLVWVTAGRPTSTTTIDTEYDSFEAKTYGTIGVRQESCRQTSTTVPLTSAGLTGGVATRLGDEFECYVPKQIVIRVRAVFEASGALHRGRDFATAHGPVREAKLVARTLAGKPLVYADVTQSGNARIFVAKGCARQ